MEQGSFLEKGWGRETEGVSAGKTGRKKGVASFFEYIGVKQVLSIRGRYILSRARSEVISFFYEFSLNKVNGRTLKFYRTEARRQTPTKGAHGTPPKYPSPPHIYAYIYIHTQKHIHVLSQASRWHNKDAEPKQ